MTMGRMSLEERLEMAAEFGKYFCFLNVWKKDIRVLREDGLIVDEQYPVCKGKFYCRLSWELAYPKKGQAPNRATRLWQIATDHNEAMSRKLNNEKKP
ncbi:MAG: hypothetical protein IJ223_04620 [Clostridia bacterium]|nr:hypothetical protein [Clostridia bacterium]